MPDELHMNIAEVIYQPGTQLNVAEAQRHMLMKVVLDSGAGAHVINKRACPG